MFFNLLDDQRNRTERAGDKEVARIKTQKDAAADVGTDKQSGS